MTGRSIARNFKKYTIQPTGFWAKLSDFFWVDGGRSTGVPMNPLFRNPPPGGNDPKLVDDPVTIPSGDIADNPYFKRDVRRSYPRLSVVNQGDVVGLLTVGSAAQPKEDILQIGEAGTKQLVELKEEGEKGLATFFQKDSKAAAGVLDKAGMPPMPPAFGSKRDNKKRYELLEDQTYGGNYPCRTFQ